MSLNAQMKPQFNQGLLDEFKKSIDYSTLVAQLPVGKDVIIDWQNALQNITDAKGTVWTSKSKDPILGLKGEAHLRLTLASCDGQAIVDVIFYAGNWQQRLDSFVSAKALTNRASINYKIKPNIDDVYLIPKDQTEITFVNFLYGRFSINVSHWDGGDVAPLADTIYQLMTNNIANTASENKMVFNVVSDKEQYAVGHFIKLKLEGTTNDWATEWVNKQAPIVDDSAQVEYIEKNDNVWLFKALKKGKVSIPFSAMNKKTLHVETKNIEIDII